MADFVDKLTSEPRTEPRHSLSKYFTTHGVDAGLAYHDQTVKVFAPANPWSYNETFTPEDGSAGRMRFDSGNLSVGAMTDFNGDAIAYVSGSRSVKFGQAGWTAPSSERVEYPVYDEKGNEIGTKAETYDDEGFHSFDNAITTLSLAGYIDTAGAYSLSAIA